MGAGGGVALAVPFSLLLPLPLQSGSGNPGREALVSHTMVFLQDGWCLAPLPAPGLPSPSPAFSRRIRKGALLSDRPHARTALHRHHTVPVLDEFLIWYNLLLSLLPACHSLGIEAIAFPL